MKVVDELDEELLLVDLIADVEDDTQLAAETRPLILGGVVGPDIAHAANGFRDSVRKAADLPDPLLAERIHLRLQLRE